MAEGTPRRGSIIAEKIALFRASGTSPSPKRTAQEEAFWWQKQSAARSDADSRSSARPEGVSHPPARSPPPAASHQLRPQQPETDARYRGLDQIHARKTTHRPPWPATSAPPPASPAGAPAAAMQRLAQEHPSLYNAVLSLERGADGRLSENALQLFNQALARSAAIGAAAPAATAAAVPGDARRAGAASAAGHTTTTVVAQPSQVLAARQRRQELMAVEMQARAEAALAAAAAATSVSAAAGAAAGDRPHGSLAHQEESMDEVLARYRRGTSRDEGIAAAAATSSAAAAPPSRGSGGPSIASIAASAHPQLSTLSPGAGPARAGQRAGENPGDSAGPSSTAATAPITAPRPAQGAPTPPRPPSPPPRPPSPPPRTNATAPGGASAIPAEAETVAAAAVIPKKPTADKLQKILRLAQMANRLGGSPPDARPTGDQARADGEAPAAASPPEDAAAQSSSSSLAAAAPVHALAAISAARDLAPPPQPLDGSADSLRSSRASVRSLGGSLASEPSLSSLHAPADSCGGRGDSGGSGNAAGFRAGGQHRAGPSGEQQADSRVAAAASSKSHAQEHVARAVPVTAEPPLSSATGGTPTAEQAAGRAAGGSAAAATAAIVAQAATAEAAAAAADDAGSSGGGAPFAFPVTAGTAVDPAAVMTRGVAADQPAPAGAATATSVADPSASRRVQFSPNEPQVRLYSEGAAPAAAGAAGGAAVPGPPPGPGALQPVFLLPSPAAPGNPRAPRPTHIFVPADPGLPPALVAVPGFEPLPPGSVTPRTSPDRRRQAARGSGGGGSSTSVSPPAHGRRSASASPQKRDGGPTALPGRGGGSAATSGSASPAAGAGSGAAPGLSPASGKQRSEIDRVLDSDSDSDTGGRMPPEMSVELRAAEQAAAQVEREAAVHTPSRLTRLLDQVAEFRRTEGERRLREGERTKMMEELKTMKIDQLTTLLGPSSELLKEISTLRDLHTGNLEVVKATADEHTRAVVDALQRTNDAAQAVKEAMVESALRQQQEVMDMVDALAPPAAPPPPARSPRLALPLQTLYGGPPATSDLLNTTWWTQLLDPTHRASLATAAAAAARGDLAMPGGDVPADAAAATAASASAAGEARWPQAAPGDLLAQQIAGVAGTIRASLDRHPTGVGTGIGIAGGANPGELISGPSSGEDLSVSAITRAARQVSMTLDMAVREYIDRTTQPSPPGPPGAATAAVGLHTLPSTAARPPGPQLRRVEGAPLVAAGAAAASPAAATDAAALVPPGAVVNLPGPQTDPWVVQPAALPPVLLPNCGVLQQPLIATIAGAAAAAAPGAVLYAVQPLGGAAASVQPPPQQLLQHGGDVAALAQPSLAPHAVPVPQGGPPPAIAAAAPQLVAVQGALPAGSASGAALLNLPMCSAPAAATGLAAAGLEAQQQRLQQHQWLSGVAAAAVPHNPTAVQPGEGLPCRMDLQLVRMLPAAAAGAAAPPSPPSPHQQQIAHPMHPYLPQQQAWQPYQPPQQQQPRPQHPMPAQQRYAHMDIGDRAGCSGGRYEVTGRAGADSPGAGGVESPSRRWPLDVVATGTGHSYGASNSGRDGGDGSGVEGYGGGTLQMTMSQASGMERTAGCQEARSWGQPATAASAAPVSAASRASSPRSPSDAPPRRPTGSAPCHSPVATRPGRTQSPGRSSSGRRSSSSRNSRGRGGDSDPGRRRSTRATSLHRGGSGSGSGAAGANSEGDHGRTANAHSAQAPQRGELHPAGPWDEFGGSEPNGQGRGVRHVRPPSSTPRLQGAAVASTRRTVSSQDKMAALGSSSVGSSAKDHCSGRSPPRAPDREASPHSARSRGGGNSGSSGGGGSTASSAGRGSSVVCSEASLAAGMAELHLEGSSAQMPPMLLTSADQQGSVYGGGALLSENARDTAWATHQHQQRAVLGIAAAPDAGPPQQQVPQQQRTESASVPVALESPSYGSAAPPHPQLLPPFHPLQHASRQHQQHSSQTLTRAAAPTPSPAAASPHSRRQQQQQLQPDLWPLPTQQQQIEQQQRYGRNHTDEGHLVSCPSSNPCKRPQLSRAPPAWPNACEQQLHHGSAQPSSTDAIFPSAEAHCGISSAIAENFAAGPAAAPGSLAHTQVPCPQMQLYGSAGMKSGLPLSASAAESSGESARQVQTGPCPTATIAWYYDNYTAAAASPMSVVRATPPQPGFSTCSLPPSPHPRQQQQPHLQPACASVVGSISSSAGPTLCGTVHDPRSQGLQLSDCVGPVIPATAFGAGPPMGVPAGNAAAAALLPRPGYTSRNLVAGQAAASAPLVAAPAAAGRMAPAAVPCGSPVPAHPAGCQSHYQHPDMAHHAAQYSQQPQGGGGPPPPPPPLHVQQPQLLPQPPGTHQRPVSVWLEGPVTPTSTAAALLSPPPGGRMPTPMPHAGRAASPEPHRYRQELAAQQPLQEHPRSVQPLQPHMQLPPDQTAPPRHSGGQLQTANAPYPSLPVLLAELHVPPAGHSEDVQRAYQATLAQLQAVYQNNGQGQG